LSDSGAGAVNTMSRVEHRRRNGFVAVLPHLGLGFVSDFVLRISDF
jgi:hypothetical protein